MTRPTPAIMAHPRAPPLPRIGPQRVTWKTAEREESSLRPPSAPRTAGLAFTACFEISGPGTTTRRTSHRGCQNGSPWSTWTSSLPRRRWSTSSCAGRCSSGPWHRARTSASTPGPGMASSPAPAAARAATTAPASSAASSPGATCAATPSSGGACTGPASSRTGAPWRKCTAATAARWPGCSTCAARPSTSPAPRTCWPASRRSRRTPTCGCAGSSTACGPSTTAPSRRGTATCCSTFASTRPRRGGWACTGTCARCS
mmetsp:Transcript_76431/g.205773  ORF Transcript_76431/g.205773 Transcript_76431/m.205773 type:complete len:259 (-) Transcript_76431:123-899(-)